MTVQKDHFRNCVCLILIALLLLSGPVRVLCSWGLEVGRADPGDVTRLASDWNAFRRERTRIESDMRAVTALERQRQIMGAAARPDWGPQEYFQQVQQLWLMKVLGPLQSIALNPAATCAEAQFAELSHRHSAITPSMASRLDRLIFCGSRLNALYLPTQCV